MSKKRILYLMHIPWGWIKQRPHFIAEELSKFYDVHVCVAKSYRLNLKNPTNVKIVCLFRFPFERFTYKLNALLYRIQLRKYAKWADVIWFTSPTFFHLINKRILDEKEIVYDCMDDYIEFPSVKESRREYVKCLENEKRLYQIASLVISSADYLKQKLINRYGSRSIIVVNNAIKEISAINVSGVNNLFLLQNKYFNSTNFKLVYIGTISRWMDFDLLIQITNVSKDIEIFLFGPTEVNIPSVNRIVYCGKIEHDMIFEVMQKSDALIMPFVVNELIRSVNPVKLYEYIYSGKPILAPLYAESKSFQDYVYLYRSHEECLSLLQEIVLHNKGPKKNIASCKLFCQNNTWKNRVQQICDALNSLNKTFF